MRVRDKWQGGGLGKGPGEGGTCQLPSPMEECDTNEQTETGFPSPSSRTPFPERPLSLSCELLRKQEVLSTCFLEKRGNERVKWQEESFVLNSKLPVPRGFCPRDPSLALQSLTLRYTTHTHRHAPQSPSCPHAGYHAACLQPLVRVAAPPVTVAFTSRSEPQKLGRRDSLFVVIVSRLWGPQDPG